LPGWTINAHFRVFERRAICFERRLERRRGRGLRLHLLAGDEAAAGQRLVARRLRPRILGLRRVAREVGLHLLQRRLERAAIQREEHLTLGHVVSLLEIHGGDRAGDLRVDGDGRFRFSGADDADFERHRFLYDRGHRYEYGVVSSGRARGLHG